MPLPIASTATVASASLPPNGNISPQPGGKLISRRNAVVLLSPVTALLPSLHFPSAASALSLSFSGPKQWLKEQKKKSAKFLLAPVDASRNTLQAAHLLLVNDGPELGGNDLEEIQSLLNSAARDCIPRDRNSFVQFQSQTGVEVCTFQLILKNASSLLDDKDPLKLNAESKLNDLIRCFDTLNGMTSELDIQVASNRKKIADALKETLFSLNMFEQGVKDCLGS
ncbi:unnamed protein product [Cuscuta europaea]|uniref:Uncharacterized protein n=1 Tax=Cuscuta europaea TaxID=41803 RepID=A0A9P0YWE9_CUSEU|nr:unnamed protein product [Cuscuta europaea]